jgi:hypothetical protein
MNQKYQQTALNDLSRYFNSYKLILKFLMCVCFGGGIAEIKWTTYSVIIGKIKKKLECT